MTPAAPVVATVLVHGIFDSVDRLRPLEDGLRARGMQHLVAVELRPADGTATIPQLAVRLRDAVHALLPSREPAHVDVVAFSMGALVTRWWMQRMGGRDIVRRFVSISGPHHGTLTAYPVPLPGPRQMRPGSTLLWDLQQDAQPFGNAEVHCVYTPLDAMIVPATSGVLPGAHSAVAFPVPLHRFMIRDARVLDHVARVLRAP